MIRIKKNICFKVVYLLLFFIAPITKQTYAQNDSILVNLQEKVSDSWSLQYKFDTLRIQGNDSMWIDFYNIAGAPYNDPEYKKYTNEYLMTHGKKVKPCILFKMEPKWTKKEKEKVVAENKNIQQKINTLLKKYKLTHLHRTYRWHEELFWNYTKQEEQRIETYKKEKEELEKKLKSLPIYNTIYHSLFIISRNWRLTEGKSAHMVPMIYPKDAQNQIQKLEETIDKLLKEDL